jgi:hypothetical protein
MRMHCEDAVPPFQPSLPASGIFYDAGELREYLLRKSMTVSQIDVLRARVWRLPPT